MSLRANNPTRLISGTFIGIDHFSDEEATRFQAELRSLTEENWRQMVRDMHAIGIDTLVFQQCATRRGSFHFRTDSSAGSIRRQDIDSFRSCIGLSYVEIPRRKLNYP
jgi:hypothetical protein